MIDQLAMKETGRIALIQHRWTGDRQSAVDSTIGMIREAARKGARIVCLQELFHMPYFCTSQDTACFHWAEPGNSPTLARMSALSAELGIVLIVPVFESVHETVFFNTVFVFGSDGALLGRYRKKHIPQDPGFEEKFYFTPGDDGWPVFDTPLGRIGVLICWDQWFPEAARILALKGARVLFYPTAIGWLPAEKAEWGAQQHCAWRSVQIGHAVANGCFVAAANRVGSEGESEFWGQSFVSDFYGNLLAEGSPDKSEVVIADLDFEKQDGFRRIWPFFRDRRPELYGDLGKQVVN